MAKCKTLTQGIADERKPGETLTECIHRLQKAGQTMTEAEKDVACTKPVPPVVAPGKPTGVTANGVTKVTADMTWTPSAKADKYTLTIVPAVAGMPASVTTHNVDLVGLTAGTSYDFKVKACTGTKCSAATTKSFTTQA